MLKRMILLVLALVSLNTLVGSVDLFSQKVAFIASDEVRERFPEAKQALQRIQAYVEEWKRELEVMKITLENLELEIKKNRLIWTDEERRIKETEMVALRKKRSDFASSHFEPNGEYDKTVVAIWKPIEEKIFAATSAVAAAEGFDYVFDKSKMPIPYTNYKFDLTVKVLKKLGVDVEQLEKDLEKKIQQDPRNKNAKEKTTKRRRRSRYVKSKDEKKEEIEQNEIKEEEDEDKKEVDKKEEIEFENRKIKKK